MDLGPQLAAPHIALAVLSSGTGRYDEAIKQAQEAIRIDPGNDRGFTELARALDAKNQPEATEATFRRAIALKANYWRNYERLGIFYANHGRYEEAIAPFRRIIELVPDNPAGYTDLGSTFHLLGRESEAEQELKKSIALRPTPVALSDLATVYFFEQRFADAMPLYEKVVADGTRNYKIWGNLGDAYRWTPGNSVKAAAAYRHAIELATQSIGVNPRDATALINRGLYRAKTGDRAEAIRDMGRALAYKPEDKAVIFYSAIIYELTGSRARALEYLRRAIHGGYSSSEIAAEPELGKLRLDPLYQAVVSSNAGH